MAAVVASGPVLADSTFKTRPNFHTYLRSDCNAGGNMVRQIEEKRRIRQMKFPSLIGRKDVDSFLNPDNPSDRACRKYNDEGDYRSPAPFRSCDNIIDPVSGFVSAAGDAYRNTGHTRIKPLPQIPLTPQSYDPNNFTSDRSQCPSAPPDLRQSCDINNDAPYNWNSRKVLDGKIRASLGGWTSSEDPRIADQKKQTEKMMKIPRNEAKELRDQLALQYMYTSSTTRAYEEVPWDSMLPPKRYVPASTLEERPDMISQNFTKKRYDAASQEWQKVGRSWDWFQTRRGHYKTDIPIPGTVFCSPNPRAQQIPGYSGCIGAENVEEIDNAKDKFIPFTVKRVPIPRPVETAHRPNIPGYKGCTLYRSNSAPAHSLQASPEPQTTARVHSYIPVTPNTSAHRRESDMSRMVTTVPPCNPYTLEKIEAVPVTQ